MNAAKELLTGLADSPAIMRQFALSIPKTALDRRRGQGFWTIREHLAHLAEVQPMISARLTRVLTEDKPVFVPYFPDENETESRPPLPELQTILDDFERERRSQLGMLRTLTPADWKRTAVHPEYDRYGLEILVRHMLLHDYSHLYRVEELWLTKDEYLTAM